MLVTRLADSSVADKTIHVGYLWQFNAVLNNSPERAGAINVGIESAQRDGLLPGFNYRYSCYQNSAAFEIVQQYRFNDMFDNTVVCF